MTSLHGQEISELESSWSIEDELTRQLTELSTPTSELSDFEDTEKDYFSLLTPSCYPPQQPFRNLFQDISGFEKNNGVGLQDSAACSSQSKDGDIKDKRHKSRRKYEGNLWQVEEATSRNDEEQEREEKEDEGLQELVEAQNAIFEFLSSEFQDNLEECEMWSKRIGEELTDLQSYKKQRKQELQGPLTVAFKDNKKTYEEEIRQHSVSQNNRSCDNDPAALKEPNISATEQLLGGADNIVHNIVSSHAEILSTPCSMPHIVAREHACFEPNTPKQLEPVETLASRDEADRPSTPGNFDPQEQILVHSPDDIETIAPQALALSPSPEGRHSAMMTVSSTGLRVEEKSPCLKRKPEDTQVECEEIKLKQERLNAEMRRREEEMQMWREDVERFEFVSWEAEQRRCESNCLMTEDKRGHRLREERHATECYEQPRMIEEDNCSSKFRMRIYLKQEAERKRRSVLTLRLQSFWRAWMCQKQASVLRRKDADRQQKLAAAEKEQQRRQASLRIQSAWRLRKTRIRVQESAARRLQSQYRVWKCRRNFKKHQTQRKSALKLSLILSYILSRQKRLAVQRWQEIIIAEKEKQRNAALVLQKCWKGQRCFQWFQRHKRFMGFQKFYTAEIQCIQKWCRGAQCRQKFQEMLSYFRTRQRAAIAVQAFFRGYRLRKRLKRAREECKKLEGLYLPDHIAQVDITPFLHPPEIFLTGSMYSIEIPQHQEEKYCHCPHHQDRAIKNGWEEKQKEEINLVAPPTTGLETDFRNSSHNEKEVGNCDSAALSAAPRVSAPSPSPSSNSSSCKNKTSLGSVRSQSRFVWAASRQPFHFSLTATSASNTRSSGDGATLASSASLSSAAQSRQRQRRGGAQSRQLNGGRLSSNNSYGDGRSLNAQQAIAAWREQQHRQE